MVNEDVYCIDVRTQAAAATRGPHPFALELLKDHPAGCVVDTARAGDDEAQAKVRGATEAIGRLVKS